MDVVRLDRRRFIAGSAALGAAALATEPALSQATQGYSAVSVDVGPLRARGLGEFAETVRAALQAELSSAFADAMDRNGPRLVVRITALSMTSYVGGSTRLGSGGTPNDYMEGEALVMGRGGAILRRHPQLSALPASSGGAWYLPDNEQRRLAAIANHYALWLRRSL